MTQAEAYDKAWRLGFNGDFSLVDKIYHPDYSAFDYRAGVEVNLEMDKVVITTLGENVTQGKMRESSRTLNFYVWKEYLNLCKPENLFLSSGYSLSHI